MYVCTYVCMYVYMQYVCMCMHIYIYIYAYAYLKHIHTHIVIYVCSKQLAYFGNRVMKAKLRLNHWPPPKTLKELFVSHKARKGTIGSKRISRLLILAEAVRECNMFEFYMAAVSEGTARPSKQTHTHTTAPALRPAKHLFTKPPHLSFAFSQFDALIFSCFGRTSGPVELVFRVKVQG